jgi:hypothetical protein
MSFLAPKSLGYNIVEVEHHATNPRAVILQFDMYTNFYFLLEKYTTSCKAKRSNINLSELEQCQILVATN